MEIPSGYLIETSFERMYRTFTRPAEPHEARYSIPRQGVAPAAFPKQYRGIARRPLAAWVEELSGAPGIETPDELEAAGDDFIFASPDVERVWSFSPTIARLTGLRRANMSLRRSG
jgi:hypothetical protein